MQLALFMAILVASKVPSLSVVPVNVSVCPTCPSSLSDFDITGVAFPPDVIVYVPALSPLDKHPDTVSAGAGAAAIMIAARTGIMSSPSLGGVENVSRTRPRGEHRQNSAGPSQRGASLVR